MLGIDGAYGEGGGQILRSALTLAILTGTEVEIADIRANRTPPGLRPQHLQAVKAAAAVSGARLRGAIPGSKRLTFHPGAVTAGEYRFDIGTAGATTLVLQTVLLPLAFAPGHSSVSVTGGTHVPWSPCSDYMELDWIPRLQSIGVTAKVNRTIAGFYPRGGGKIVGTVAPATLLRPMPLTDRGPLRAIRVQSMVARLPSGIADRQAQAALERLSEWGGERKVRLQEPPAAGPGSMLLLQALFDRGSVTTFALGGKGKRAERVGEEAAAALEEVLRGNATVDEHGADQILIPLALAAGESMYHTPKVTRHLETVAWVSRQFLPVEIEIEGKEGLPGTVRIRGIGFQRQKGEDHA